MTRAALVVGAGGLLGSAVVRRLAETGRPFATVSVPWRTDRAAASLLSALAETIETWDGRGVDVLWCAGAAVTGARPEDLAAELATFDAVVDGVLADPTHAPAQFFLASSAGGVYAGVDSAPPFTENTPPRALAPYGHGKLALERSAQRMTGAGTRVLVGRISNLYGPGQDLSKDQGLITRLCRTYLTRDPARIYVSLDTIRDYLFVDDAADLVLDAVDRLAREPGGTLVTKILCSHRPTTIAALLGHCKQVFGPRVPVTLGASPLAHQQARDLRFRSVVWPELDVRPQRTLVSGIHRTVDDLRRTLVAPHA